VGTTGQERPHLRRVGRVVQHDQHPTGGHPGAVARAGRLDLRRDLVGHPEAVEQLAQRLRGRDRHAVGIRAAQPRIEHPVGERRGELVGEADHQGGLADSRLAVDRHHRGGLASLTRGEMHAQQPQLLRAADEPGGAGRKLVRPRRLRGDADLREPRPARQAAQDRAAPQLQRGAERLGGGHRIPRLERRAAVAGKPLELGGVELLRADPQHVAVSLGQQQRRWRPGEPLRLQGLAQMLDVAPYGGLARPRRRAGDELLQRGRRHRPVGPQQECSQHQAQPGPEPDGGTANLDLDGPEDSKVRLVHCAPRSLVRSTASAEAQGKSVLRSIRAWKLWKDR
jgi:hypothetical protein